MQLSFLCLLLLALCGTVFARPQYKAVDYKLYGELEEHPGVAIDAVYEFVTEKPPDDGDALDVTDPPKHHHHHHHKKLEKTNRLERLKRYLQNL